MATNSPNPTIPALHRSRFRVNKVRAQVKLLRDNRQGSARHPSRLFAFRTSTGNGLTKAELIDWISDDRVSNPAIGRVVEVYIEQLCYYINASRNLAFYIEIYNHRDQAASQMLRDASITTAEFAQLEYFFVPIEFAEHSDLLAVSPRHHTIELCDSTTRSPRPLFNVFKNIIRFLIHELGSLPGPDAWMFKYNNTPTQNWASECGNFTCFYAKALATYQPLTPNLDIGQGNTDEERHLMRYRVADELLMRHRWSAATHPIGNPALYGPAARHAITQLPGTQPGRSEPQHLLFQHFPPFAHPLRYPLRDLRSRTGRFDHFTTTAQLAAWCAAQPALTDRQGTAVARMQGYQTWETMALPWFVERVEVREMLIAQGAYP